MSEDPVRLVTARPDAEIAADLKERFVPACAAILTLIGEAKRVGMHINFAIGDDLFGRPSVTMLKVVKEL